MQKLVKRRLLIPLAFAVPLCAAVLWAYFRYGEILGNLIDVAVKSVVKQG